MALETMTPLPRAMLIDMDDTILSAYGRPEIAWNKVAAEFSNELAPLSSQQVASAVLESGRRFWTTAEAAWRLKLAEARQVVVKDAFAVLAAAGQPALPADLAVRLADRLTAYREEEMFMFPGAHDAIDALKARGVKLALVTNGAADTQRAKVERFELAHRFDHIQIEGEHGFGKPEERAYLHAMEALGVTAPETWMIGDNLEWEIEVPQRLGIYAIWMDAHGDGLPADTARQAGPDHPVADGTAAGGASIEPQQAPVPLPNQKYRKQPHAQIQTGRWQWVMPARPFDTSGKSPALIQGAASSRRAGIHFTSPRLFAGVKGVGERPLWCSGPASDIVWGLYATALPVASISTALQAAPQKSSPACPRLRRNWCESSDPPLIPACQPADQSRPNSSKTTRMTRMTPMMPMPP